MHEPRDADPFFAEIPLSLSSPESFSISLSFLFDYLFLDPPGVCLNKKTPSYFVGGVSAVTHLLFRAASV